MKGKKPLISRALWKCEHAHTGEGHPNCWRRFQEEYMSKDLRLGYLDIEANGLQGDFNIMYSWAIKPRDSSPKEILWDCMQVPDEPLAETFDKRTTQACIDTMRKFDVLYTYYGTGFDMPMIRTRALDWGLEFPAYGEIQHVDLYYLVKSKLQLHSNRLASVASLLHVEEKSPLEPTIWKTAMVNPHSMSYIVQHNKQDVVVLEEVHKKLETFMKGNRKSL